MKKHLLVGAFLFYCSSVLAQDSLTLTDGFRTADGWTTRKVVSAGLVTGFLGGSLVSSYYDWWNANSQSFHFVREGFWNDYSLGIDKFGHAFTSYFYFNTFRYIMLWGGFTPKTAFWWSFGTTAFFAISIEVGDGLSPYGFSFEDLTANGLGLGFAVLQEEYPFFRNFSLKWSYVPTDGYRFPPRFTDHYDGHTYWLAFNMHNLLPGDAGNCWPEFLQLAVGYSVADQMTKRELVIGLDLNLRAFDVEQPELLLVRNTVDMIHLPAPAIKFTEDKPAKAYLFNLN